MNTEQLLMDLRRHEGFRGTPYFDTEGIVTIGTGRNLLAYPYTEEEDHVWMLNIGIPQALTRAAGFAGGAWPNLNEARQRVLVNMAFNLGGRLLGFRKMRACLKAYDYNGVADEMLSSKWAEQVGDRARELARTMRSGR